MLLAVASVVQAPIGEGAWDLGGVRPRPDLDPVRSSRDVRRERGGAETPLAWRVLPFAHSRPASRLSKTMSLRPKMF